MARGIDDVAVSVVASPQSTVIGGATETVRDLVARWEQRDVMAREVAVDVASHSPQVDPILDDLAAALADLTPMPPKVPYYSATLLDPRERPVCDAGYWVDNLRHTVQFAAAVQAALEDGYRVFAELSPHPLLTHAVDQTARSLDMSAAALAGMRREQPLPHGLRGLLTDLHGAGAAVDFSVLYPAGRLVDAPLPAWTHRRLFIEGDGQEQQVQGACTIAVHPLLGSHVRLIEEPERHVWQADVGTAALPWLSDHQVHNVAALPGAAYCEMALAAAGEVFGEASEVRDIAFEQMLLLDDQTPIDAVASVDAPGVVDFVVETNQDGENTRHATAALHAAEDDPPPSPRHGRPACGASVPRERDRVAGVVRRAWCSVRSCFHRSGRRAHCGDGRQHRAGRGRAACFDPLPAGRLPRPPGAAGCLFPVRRRSPRRRGQRQWRPAVAVGCAPPTCLRSDPQRPLLLHAGDQSPTRTGGEADLDVLDEHGTVLLTVRGLRMGTGTTETGERERVLSERLLTLEWQQRTLPEVASGCQNEAGSWLLIDTSDAGTC